LIFYRCDGQYEDQQGSGGDVGEMGGRAVRRRSWAGNAGRDEVQKNNTHFVVDEVKEREKGDGWKKRVDWRCLA